MRKKKKVKLNLKKFIPFCLICLALIAGVIGLLTKGLRKDPEPACKHQFEAGVCTLCGEKDPDYKDPEPEDPRASWPNTTTPASAYPLSKADDDLLVLVNKEMHVTKDYRPADLVTVSRYVEGVGNADTHKLRKTAADALEKMLDAAEADGMYIRMRTGFRSYDYQVSLFDSYAKNHGEAEANKYSARAGESEHQTGLACDLGGKSQSYALSDYFGDTAEGEWVKENCWKYGFILRYTDGTLDTPGAHTGYVYEAWHVRYVGSEAAKIITENNWTLEEYLNEISSFASH